MDPSSVLNSTSPARTEDVLPLVPVLTPAFGVAGAILITTGLAYCLAGRRCPPLYGFLSCFYSFGLGVTVLILEAANLPVSHATQGAYLVAVVLPALLLSAVITQFSLHNAERLGGFIGGFCIAMWFEVFRSEGLIRSQLVALWIVPVSLLGYALACWPKTGYWAHLVCSAFAGATAMMLGVDCFSRTGLKEFWVYTWRFRNYDIFSYQNTTYPLTRGIKIEIGCIAVLFVLGLISQYKLYIPSVIMNKLVGRQYHEDHEGRVGGVEDPIEVTDSRNRSLVEVPQGEKKTPNVQQIQVSPESPTQTDHRRSQSVANWVQTRPSSDARTLVATGDERRYDDEISPVEVPADNTDSAGNTLQTRSLRPTSHPPRPIVPHSDDEPDSSSDGIAYVPFGSTGNSLPFLGDRVSSTALSRLLLETGENEGHGEADNPNSPKEFQLDLFPWELTPVAGDGDEDSIQKSIRHSDQESVSKPHVDQENTNGQREESESGSQNPDLPESESRGRRRSSDHILRLIEMEKERKEEVMIRTNEWRKAVVRVESDLNAPVPDEDCPSLWSDFEGTHTTDGIVDQKVTNDIPAPRLPESALSRASPFKQKKRRSRRVSIVEGKAAILPPSIKSARVHERNLSLPVLNTGTNLLNQRENIVGQRRKHKSHTHALAIDGSAGHVAMENFHSVGWVPPEEDDMTLAEKRATLQAARRTSSGQASSLSSNVPYTPNSTCIQSPNITTARTTPIASSPAHTLFIQTALPLRGAYPSPPGVDLTPVAPYRYCIPSSVPNGINAPAFGEGIPRPTIQDNGLPTPHTKRIPTVPVKGAPSTLVGQIEEQEKHRERQRQDMQKASQKAAEDSAKLRKEVETQRHRSMQLEQMLRSGKYEDAHRENLRKMQRKATDNANKAG